MADINLKTIRPDELSGHGETGLFDTAPYSRKYLAQGDSWFSIGHVPFWSTTNLLEQMVLSRSALAVSCASPGAELTHMTDTSTTQVFLNLLNGNTAWHWDALLMSGGGNDLIAAALVAPGAPLDQRLLRSSDEWLPVADASRYLSGDGWSTFTKHMDEVLQLLLKQRDRKALNRGIPLVLHTYDHPTVRDAPAGPHMGPWLYRAMHDLYELPEADWDALARLLIDRCAEMWLGLAQKYGDANIHVVDSRGSLTPAQDGSSGASGDWENEIHPTPNGYALLGRRWREVLDGLP